MDESIPLVAFSKRGRRARVETVDCAYVEVGSKIRVPRRSGFDAAYGARPLKRLVTKSLETPLSRAILGGGLKSGDVAHFTVRNERLVLDVRAPGDDAPPPADADTEEEEDAAPPTKKSRSLSR